jgi:hypothetical protein
MNNDFLPPRGPDNQRHNFGPQRPFQRRRAIDVRPNPHTFRTPEAVAAAEEQHPETNTAGPIIGHQPTPKKTMKEHLKSMSKKQWALIIILAVVLIGGGTFGAMQLFGNDKKSPVTQQNGDEQDPTPKPTPLYSKLTGLPISDPKTNERQVTAIMIENSPYARPQSGLNKAGIVFEAVAEGGITRFLTLWQDTSSEYIGPVRSVRPYYVQWLMGFDAAVAHVGGSGDALALIRKLGAKDIDQFHNPQGYWRINERYAPHNMYTSISRLRQVQNSRGYTKSTFTGFSRKDTAPAATPTARTIDFRISGANYDAHYKYSPSTNSYKRWVGGEPHTDQKSKTQLSPKVVVGLVMPQSKNGVYTVYDTIGSGPAFIFQDGLVIKGTWKKGSAKSQFVFVGANGEKIKLNRGQTWFTVVGGSDRVTYKP